MELAKPFGLEHPPLYSVEDIQPLYFLCGKWRAVVLQPDKAVLASMVEMPN